jgi:DNA repair protein RadC
MNIESKDKVSLLEDVLGTSLPNEIRDISMQKLSSMTEDALLKITGIKKKTAKRIAATFELGRRSMQSEAEKIIDKISSSGDIYRLLIHHVQHKPIEEFWVVYMDMGNKVLSTERVSVGGVSACYVDRKVILKRALELDASVIAVAHNHPSGRCNPSIQDLSITSKIKDAAKLIDICLIDHIIICDSGYYSFSDEGTL